MPVTCPIKFTPVSEDEFRKLDYRIMEHAFASHNDLGRLCDERIYEADLKARLEGSGLGPIAVEVPLTVAWKGFVKTYYLDRALYLEALTWFLGGDDKVVQRLDVVRDGINLGTQRCYVHSPDVGFKLTAHTENQERGESHLRRFIAHTSLQAIQWVNLNHTRIEFITLRKE